MDSKAQDLSSQEQDVLAGKVMDSMGEPEGAQEIAQDGADSSPSDGNADPLYVQKRLKQQRRIHERDTRIRDARIAELEQRIQSQSSNQYGNSYSMHGDQPLGVDEQIHKAVSYALNHRDAEERKAREAESAAKVQRHYNELRKHLDSMGDKYNDFHDVVLGDDSEFTHAMRDYALTLPRSGSGSAGEVLYKLGKNPDELERIAKLHPVEQASEMAKLSHALILGGENKSTSQSRPLGQIKTMPVTNSHNVTEKTPIGSLRERMKSGKWK